MSGPQDFGVCRVEIHFRGYWEHDATSLETLLLGESTLPSDRHLTGPEVDIVKKLWTLIDEVIFEERLP